MFLKIVCIIIYSFWMFFLFVKCYCFRLIVFFVFLFRNFLNCFSCSLKNLLFLGFCCLFFFLIIVLIRLFFCRYLIKCWRVKESNIKIRSYVYVCLYWLYFLILSKNVKFFWGSLKCIKRIVILDVNLLFCLNC